MRVEELIVDGFKSYATRTVISHWDPQFNAITGLNGSGKSNILDAICFVLGIASMATVRASNLQDLIYKRGQAGVTKASVTIVFDNSDRSKSPIGFETYPKISVTRQVNLGGTSKYLINGHRAQQQTVLQLFQSVQLNINNPNFLIMQGKITKVLNMKPKEILSLIEEAAGTKMFEDRRQKAEKVMAKKDIKLEEIKTLLKEEIIPKLDKYRNEKRLYLEFQDIQLQLEEIENVVATFDYHKLSTQFNNSKQISDEQTAQLTELQEKKASLVESLDILKQELEEANSRKQNNENVTKKSTENAQSGRDIKALEKMEADLTNEVSRLASSLNLNKDDLKDDQVKLANLQKNMETMMSQLHKLDESCRVKTEDYESIKKKFETLQSDHRLKEELLSSLTVSLSKNGNESVSASGYQQQITALRTRLNQVNITMKSTEMKLNALENEKLKNNQHLEQARAGHENLQKKLESLESEKLVTVKKLQSFGYDPNILKELKKKEIHLKNNVHNFRNQAEQWKRKLYSLDFQYAKENLNLTSKDAIKGVAATLFTLDESKHDMATALQVCAGGRLYNVVVDNEKTASQLLERGKLKKRVTIIPLNKISTRTLRNETVLFAKSLSSENADDVDLALNLIEYSADVTKAMEFIFGTSLICKNADLAKKVTFHPKIRTKSITLDGDVYDPEGTLSGGSRNNNGANILIEVQKFNQCLQQLRLLEQELEDVQRLIKKHQETSEQTIELQESVNLCEHKILTITKELQNSLLNQYEARNAEIEETSKSLQKQMEANMLDVSNITKNISQTEKDMKEFNSNKGAKLEQLKSQIVSLSKALELAEDSHEAAYDEQQTVVLEREQVAEEIEELKKQEQDTLSNINALHDVINKTAEQVTLKSKEFDSIHLTLTEAKEKIRQMNEEIRQLSDTIKEKNNALKQTEVDYQIMLNEHQSFIQNVGSLESRLKALLEKHSWLDDEKMVSGIIERNSNIDLNEFKSRREILATKFSAMKSKVNTNIMSMIENVEKKESTLKTMIKTIEKDKKKIGETVKKLNEYKKDTLVKTWEKVSIDFGQIFSELLPNSFAKLVILEHKEITEGLEVKVKLGKIWKESLVELSGGQRSLIALSLILALLQFKPAPMYILDEVDAALDLSHTQNIGHLIKTRFKGSQFIVVSLKEGMFTNANRVFRTRFQDGTSVVNIMT
ncbi:hypothetical protein ACO0QE_001525 [Hanseniaspora vineae]